MWEYRLAWTAGKPAWWDEAWKSGTAALRRQDREPEKRPDFYLVLLDRADVGLKLRGGAGGDFDAKVLHARNGGWELWEKVAFFKWNELEAIRFAALVRERRSPDAAAAEGTPTQGAQAELENLGILYEEVKVEKTRIQTSAREMLGGIAASQWSSDWLAELVEIRLPDRGEPLLSACVETMEPIRGGIEPFAAGGALCCGYPELLIRHRRKAL
jgi:hypothetical protein